MSQTTLPPAPSSNVVEIQRGPRPPLLPTTDHPTPVQYLSLREVEALSRTHTRDAIDVLHKLMMSDDTPASARISAADTLLDRGWGKARQVVSVTTTVERLSDEQLRAQIEMRLLEVMSLPSLPVVEHEHVPDAELVAEDTGP